jgi:hypothetical protein
MTNDFPGHVPGHPYLLNREQFAAFAAIKIKPDDDGSAVASFWADIAAFEARRAFDPGSNCCHSSLKMSTDCGSPMRWEYTTTSGTVLYAYESRQFEVWFTEEYPYEDYRTPDPIFQVTIPADRDQPGRYHWEQLRNGGAYCS